MGSMPPAHARGYAGEQSMGFFFGERGYFIVEGPSGSAGHGLTASGFDGVAFNPKTSHLVVYDNKAYARVGNAANATAIDRARNLGQNLDGLILRVQAMKDMPNKFQILDMLRKTKVAVQTNGPWPDNVDVAVSNASGRSTGVGSRLAGSGISFIDYYQAPSIARRVLSNQDVAAFLGTALANFFEWLGEMGIQHQIDNRLKNELSPDIQNILLRGNGVLIIIVILELEIPDINDKRGRNLFNVYVHGGPTQASAREDWERTPRLLQGPPKGWRTVTEYSWIPPLE